MKRFDDTIPIYLQLRTEIEKAIITGAIPEGEAIPSIRKIAQDYMLNPQTVANALTELVNEDIIFKKRGLGFFVQTNAREKLKEQKLQIYRETELREVLKKGKSLGVKKQEIKTIVDDVFGEYSSEDLKKNRDNVLEVVDDVFLTEKVKGDNYESDGN
ncbi:MAG: GntR family transcriptional regulator [Candidatus Cloacimonetes bacterium]|nr:GntR family transcriptional regulator [Candidatus Cloacimonadota bacterium]